MTRRLELFALIAIPALAASFLFLNSGFLNTRGGGDSPFLLFRLHQLYSALTQGVFPVRWMPDAAYGLGYPFFSYYAALPLYLAALFKLLGASYVFALKLTQLVGFALAAVAMHGWMRSIGTGRLAAWTAAAAYTFAPFHLVNVYVRGDSLNEFFAFALYPLCLWAAQSLAGAGSTGEALRRSLYLAFAYAALALTHNISVLIFSPFLGLYGLLVLFSGQKNRSLGFWGGPARLIISLGFGILLGLALSAFFWYPALREADFGQLAPVTSGYFHYSNHFRGLDLIQSAPVFNYDVGSTEATPFAMGLAHALMVGLSILVVAARAIRVRRAGQFALQGVCLFGLFAIATFMITPLSRPLWDNLPLLPFVQFPWRFLSLQSLFASALIGLAIRPPASTDIESQTAGDDRPTQAAASIPSYILATAVLIACVLSAIGLRPDFVAITDADVTPERLGTYEYFTGNIGTTINYEYLPRWTQPRPYASEEFIFGTASLKVLSGEASGERVAKRAASQTWRILVNSDSASLAVPLLYWPGWGGTIDGQSVEVHPAEGLGWIAFDLPEGEHTLELKLGDTDTRRMATLVSLAALLVALGLAQPWRLAGALLAPSGLFGKRSPKSPDFGQNREILDSSLLTGVRLRLLIPAALAIIALAITGRVLNAQSKPTGAATMDFDQQGYLYSSAVRFGNGDQLLGYNYSADVLAPGDWLGIALQWQASNRAVFTLDLVSPAEHLLKLPRTYASVSGVPQDQIGVRFQIPDDVPTGVYLLRLSLIQDVNLLAPAFASNNQPRGALYLRPIRILRAVAGPDVQLSLVLTSAVALADINATQTDPASLTLSLDWQAINPVPANYMLAIRLRDDTGFELAALDVQPTGGIYPTSAWRVGEIIPDVYQFELPSGLPPGNYPLTLTLYDAATLAEAGSLTTPIQLSQWSPPPGTEPLHRFTDTLALHDISLPATTRAGDRLAFTARWTSLAALAQDLTARWSAVSRNGEVVAYEDQPLAVIPTSQWAAGALVLSRPAIKLPISARPGEYILNVQLLNPAGELLSPPVAVGTVVVTETERTTTLPPMQFEEAADFDLIRLAGYDTALTPDTLTLTLHYQARGEIEADYKYFVHIFDPADETIPVQADGFPEIPTSGWEDGEVVSVTISLPLNELEQGIVYNLGTGWYDPEAGERLGERVILSQGVIKP